MKEEKVIIPTSSIDSTAILGVDHEYFDAKTGLSVK
jgi:hypothetical protein